MRFLFHRSEKTRFAGAALLALVALGPAGWAEASMPKAPALAQITKNAGGERTAELPPHEPRGSFASLRELANASSVVIVGTTGRYGRVRRMPDGHGSQVLFTTKVDQVLKGDILPSVSVTVMQSAARFEPPPGGMEEGRSREVEALPLFAGATYLMFLTALPDGVGYVPTGGAQGLYWLRPDGSVQPADLRSQGLLGGRPRPRSTFLAEAQAALGGTRVVDGDAPDARVLDGRPEATTPDPQPEQAPPPARSARPRAVPGRIEAEDFDERSRPPVPEGRQAAGLDVLAVPPRGHALVTKRRDDWFQYRVAVARTGSYLVEARVAATGCGGQVHLEVDGADATGPLPIPNTNSRSRSFELIRKNGVTLAAGDHALRLVVDAVPPGAPSAATIDFVQIMPALQGLAPSSPLAAAASPAREPAHPRLLLTPTRIREIQRAVTVRGSHHELLFQRMKRRIEQGAPAYEVRGGPDDVVSMQQAAFVQEAALLYILSGRRTDVVRAFEAVQAVFAVTTAPSLLPQRPEYGGDLARRSRVGLAVALAYDWCFSGWSEAQRAFVRDRLRQMLDAWPCVGYPELEPPYQRSAVAQFRGAELIVMLALGEEASRSSRYSQLKSWLIQHLSTAYGEEGATSRSGIDVSYASGWYLFPAVYACRSVGDHSLDTAFDSKAWWRLMYLGSVEGPPVLLGASTIGPLFRSGWASLIFPSVPRDRLGHYLWFFDRHLGRAAAQFDDADGGAVWGLLYYPDSALAVEPSEIPTAFHDRGAGQFVVRDGWSSSRLLAALTTDPRRQDESGPERGFDLEVLASGQRLVSGAGTFRWTGLMGGLLVDGLGGSADHDLGTLEAVETRPGAGYALVDGGERYTALGLEAAQRHFLADFTTATRLAVISTLDRLQSSARHVYTWRVGIPGLIDGNASLRKGIEKDLETFVIEGADKTLLKGWVLSPSEARVFLGDPLQVAVRADTADLWIAMALVKGEEPTARRLGEGLNAVLELSGLRLSYDVLANRIVVTSSAPRAGGPKQQGATWQPNCPTLGLGEAVR